MVVNISNIKTGINDDLPSKENKINLEMRNSKNPVDDLYDEEENEWEDDDDFIAGLFTFKK